MGKGNKPRKDDKANMKPKKDKVVPKPSEVPDLFKAM